MIDEKKLIKDFNNNYMVKNDGTWNDAIDRCVYLARTAPQVGGWIPVSERLPDIDINNPDQYVLISCWSKADDYFVQEALVYRDSNDVICFDSLYWKDKVLAWMPLPECWKGESDG